MLILTPELCSTVYDALSLTKPFSNWNLPAGEDVTFSIIKTPRWQADHRKERHKSKHFIRVSAARVSTWHRLIVCIAHEMVHLHLKHNKCDTKRDHGLAFQREAALVCKYHRDFDPKDF